MPPLIRRYNRAVPAALNAFALASDQVSTQTFTRLPGNNTIQDIVNSPNPAAGLTYEIRLLKEFIETGRSFFSESLAETSAGRVAVGPINLGPANYAYNVAQTLGALTAYNFIVKYAGGFT